MCDLNSYQTKDNIISTICHSVVKSLHETYEECFKPLFMCMLLWLLLENAEELLVLEL